MSEFAALMELLAEHPPGPVFNPWFERDQEHDSEPQAPDQRRSNLLAYLGDRVESAQLLLVGEALGYQGGHFSGLAMTSERILLGHHRKRGLDPQQLDLSLPTARTSRPAVKQKGFSEPTATIVWGALHKLGLPGRAVVLWNAFPWHPYDPDEGLLTNRKPNQQELDHGRPALQVLLQELPGAQVGAVGRVAEGLLQEMGIDHVPLRHPAHGGASEFRSGLKALIDGMG